MIDIAEARKQLGLTQVQLAAILGVTVGTVSTWERGTHVNPLAPFAMQALLDEYLPPTWHKVADDMTVKALESDGEAV